MRGLVAVLGLGIAAIAVVVVIGVEVVAPALVASAVRGSSVFAGQPISVEVHTSLTGVLLHGWIDEIVVNGAGIRRPPLQVSRLALTATDVRILDRTAARLGGTLSGVTITTIAGTEVPLGDAIISGAAGDATIVGTVAPAALEAALAAELQPLGIAASQVRLVSGTIRISLAGREDVATLRLDAGSLVLDPGGGRPVIPLVQRPTDGSWQLSQVSVSATGARVTASLDLARLALGS